MDIDRPLAVCGAEQRTRIPADVAIDRILSGTEISEYDRGVAAGRALEQRIKELEKILVRFAVIDSDAIYDPEGYDDGILMIRINRVKKYLLSKG